jgi:ribosomal protein S18 acetylase RimI-like enzyme
MVISVVNTIKIRAPREAEREQFFQVYQTGLPNVDLMPYEEFLKLWTRSKENGTLSSLWRVALLDSELVGVVMNFISNSLQWGIVWELAVIPEQRNKGVGASLVRESQSLFLQMNPTLSHFALGVKTHNQRALAFYERLGYGIRSLVIHFRGPANFAEDDDCSLESATVAHVHDLTKMKPDVYWSSKDEDHWKLIIQEPETYIVRMDKKNETLGFLRFEIDNEFEDTTAVNFAYKAEHGIDVIKSASNRVETGNITFWVQDSHQDIIEYLYNHSFQRVDSEYLLLQKIGSSIGRQTS